MTGEAEDHPAVVATPLEQPDPEPSASAVVFSWLIENQSLNAPMAVVSPVLVLLTVWDAAASAGSGLAAPASGLGTFVLLILLDKTRFASDARLLRRRTDS